MACNSKRGIAYLRQEYPYHEINVKGIFLYSHYYPFPSLS